MHQQSASYCVPDHTRASLISVLVLAVGCVSLLAVSSSSAQETSSYVERVWSVSEGLPIQRLSETTLLQTRDGYLWIGSRAGLVRFDGLRFQVFTTDNTDGLPGNRIRELFEARDGSMWIATMYGYLVRYKDRSFTPILSDADDTPDPTLITSFFEDIDSTLWIGTSRGVLRVRDGKLDPYLPEVLDVKVEDLYVDQRGTLWIAAGEAGLLKVRGDTVVHYSTQDGLAAEFASRIHFSNDGVLWLQHPDGKLSHLVDGVASSAFRGAGSIEQPAHSLYRDHGGRLWLSVADQLYYYRDGDWQPVAYGQDLLDLVPKWSSWSLAQLGEMIPDELAAPPTDKTNAWSHHSRSAKMIRDRENSVWFTGEERGLIRLRPAVFQTVSAPPQKESATAEEKDELNLYALAESKDGSLWFGSLLGRLSQRRPDGTFHHYGRPEAFSFPSWAIFEDRAGHLWVNGALCRRDTNGSCGRFESVVPLQSRIVRAILQDRQGAIWFGTDDGLSRLVPGPDPENPQGGTWTHYTTSKGLSHPVVQAIYEGSDGALWLATNGGGVNRFYEGRFTHISAEHGLSSDRVRAIYEDERGVLWVGTEDLGLNRIAFDQNGSDRLDFSTAEITVFRKEDGLYSNGLHTILEDEQGRLWMSTNVGIFWVDRNSLDAFAEGQLHRILSTAYTTADGLVDQEANGGSGHTALRTKNGSLWFATQAGAAVVNPAEAKPNLVAPPVAIETAKAGHEIVPINNERISPGIGLRDIEITYTGLSLAAPALTHFRYRLEGYDDTWVEAGSRRSAIYTHVPPGQYTFRVIAANSSEVWTQGGATLSVVIPHFFYETWWFRLLTLFALAATAASAYRRHVRGLVRRKQELEQIIEERTRALRAEKEITDAQSERLLELDGLKTHFFENISHEFRTPLTLIIGPLQQLLRRSDRPNSEQLKKVHETMLRNSRRLLRLINQILDLGRVESGQMNLDAKTQDVMPLLQEVVRAFTPLAERNGISLTLQPAQTPRAAQRGDGAATTFRISYDREKLGQVFSNLLSNALKFTPDGGKVTVLLRDVPAGIEVDVADTGSGIPIDDVANIFDRFSQVENRQRRRDGGSGIGLSIVKEFVELHGGTVRARSKLGEGTTFTVQLPKPNVTDGDLEPVLAIAATDPPDVTPDDGWLVLETDVLQSPNATVHREDTLDDEDRVTVLVVDDNADIRVFIRSILEENYRVVEARDGVQGLEVAQETLPDLIIADVMMPRMDGLAFNRELKQQSELACIPVILLTAKTTAGDQIAGLESGSDAYVTKPFDTDVLVARVRALLRIRHRLRDQLVLSRNAAAQESDASNVASKQSPLCDAAREVILRNLDNPDFSVEQLADEMAMSRWQLRRRLVEEIDLSPTLLLRQARLEAAADLLSKQTGNVTEIAFAVGFRSLSHFSRSFRAQYDVTPSAYLEEAAGLG